MKIELHMHTAYCSGCGKVYPKDSIKLYKENGYDAVVITDHFNRNSDGYSLETRKKPYSADFILDAYRDAEIEGKKNGVTVLLGCEISLHGSSNDYLLYGVNDDFFNHPEYLEMSIRELSGFCFENDILLYQAHPMRNGMTIVRPELLFGIEVNNGNPRHDSRNDISSMWAKKYSLHGISGSDFHQMEDVGQGGIITSSNVCTMDDLKEVLRSDNYTIIHKQ